MWLIPEEGLFGSGRGRVEQRCARNCRFCSVATRTPAKLTALRDRLRRSGRLRAVLKKLLSPGLEKALVFLDERLMGATSNAVEPATGDTGRCRRPCTGCGRDGRSSAAWRWT